MQPQSNANAIGLRPAGGGKRQQRPRGAFGGGQGGPRPHQPQRQRVNFDEIQPASNANASPFGRTTLSVPNAAPHGNPEGPGNRGNRSGPRGRPQGKGGAFRGKGGPGKPRPQGQPRGEADGNVARREDPQRAPREVDGNVAVADPRPPQGDDE